METKIACGSSWLPRALLIHWRARSRIPKIVRSTRVRRAPITRRRRVAPAQSRRGRRVSRGVGNAQIRNDRVLRAPAAVGSITRSGFPGDRVPVLRSAGRNMTVTHCERFYSVVTTGTGFACNTFALNPGLTSVFPWLAQVANRYEKFKFRSLIFRYVPQSAALAGTVSLAFDFDPNDDPPTSMQEANTYHDYVTTSLWAAANLKVDLLNGDRLPQKNTRPGLPGGDIDLNVYDVGQLHVMTEGAAAATLGYVEVLYTVDLFIHQTQAGVGGRLSASTGLDATHLYGSDSVSDADAYIPGTVTATNVFTFSQPFEGIVSFLITGAAGLAADFAPVIAGGGVAASLQQTVNAATTAVVGFYRVRAFTGNTLTSTITAAAGVTNVYYYFASGSYASYAV